MFLQVVSTVQYLSKSDRSAKCGAAVVKVPKRLSGARGVNCGIFVPQAFFMVGRLGLLACQPAKGWRSGGGLERLGPVFLALPLLAC